MRAASAKTDQSCAALSWRVISSMYLGVILDASVSPNVKVGGGSQPPMTLDLFFSKSAGFRWTAFRRLLPLPNYVRAPVRRRNEKTNRQSHQPERLHPLAIAPLE